MSLNKKAYEQITLNKSKATKKFDSRFRKQHIKAILNELRANKNNELRTDAEQLNKELFKEKKIQHTNRYAHELKNYVHINNAIVDALSTKTKAEVEKILKEKYAMSLNDFFNERLAIDISEKSVEDDSVYEHKLILITTIDKQRVHKTKEAYDKCMCSDFTETTCPK